MTPNLGRAYSGLAEFGGTRGNHAMSGRGPHNTANQGGQGGPVAETVGRRGPTGRTLAKPGPTQAPISKGPLCLTNLLGKP